MLFVQRTLAEAGYRSVMLHGKRSQEERDAAVAGFKAGKAQVRNEGWQKFFLQAGRRCMVCRHACTPQLSRTPSTHACVLHKQAPATRPTARTPPQVLVASDVASRGLDIRGLPYVVNYDFPSNLESYIHRCVRVCVCGSGLLVRCACAAAAACVRGAHRPAHTGSCPCAPPIASCLLRPQDWPHGAPGGRWPRLLILHTPTGE